MPTVLVNHRLAAAALLAVTLRAPAAVAADALVPADLQAAILVRVLAYDRALKQRAGDAVDVAVLAKSSDPSSTKAQSEMMRALESGEARSVQGLPIRPRAVSFKDAAALGAALGPGTDVVYLPAGLQSEVAAVRELCAARKLVTISPVRAYVEAGTTLGVVPKAGRPSILVNRAAAAAAGMDLDPKLLQLSEVLR